MAHEHTLPMNEGMESDNRLIDWALAEDIGPGDVTTLTLVPERAKASASIIARAPGVVAGAHVVAKVFLRLDPSMTCKIMAADGTAVQEGDVILRLQGQARAILTGERTALNFLQRLSGIASLTAQYRQQAGRDDVALLDTRKTTPGWRALEKYAVTCGGGENHRMGLYDRVMIKDNHLAFWAGESERSIREAVRAARSRYPDLEVQVEIDHPEQLDDLETDWPDWVLLDNMTPNEVRACVSQCQGHTRTEVSGGVTLDTIAEYAAAGPDAISIGALTHSATALDCSLELDG